MKKSPNSKPKGNHSGKAVGRKTRVISTFKPAAGHHGNKRMVKGKG